MDPITNLFRKFSESARSRRALIFKERFYLDANTKILDLGSESGENISRLLQGTTVPPENVYIADIDSNIVESGAQKFGFNPVVISESGQLPFEDQYFDVVYCSSVIEHVTVPKQEVWGLHSGREFRSRSLARQQKFVDEVRRLGKQYFVQTPYRYFPIESHSWLPFVAYLPRRLLVRVLRISNWFWVKKTSPDWYLLNRREMRELFPDAEIIEETALGLTKSLMAVKAISVSSRGDTT